MARLSPGGVPATTRTVQPPNFDHQRVDEALVATPQVPSTGYGPGNRAEGDFNLVKIQTPARRTPKLVIFDCDGVLVDSESLNERGLTRVLQRFGVRLGPDTYRNTFHGLTNDAVANIVTSRWGVTLPANFSDVLVSEERRAMLGELRAVSGVAGVVRSVIAAGSEVCVASNGPPEAIALRLNLTGLYPWFEGKLFSAAHVARGKPFPDVFLYAAETMGLYLAECAVIEDSKVGVQAGLAAGMRVFAYDGGVGAGSRDLAAAVHFHDMNDLPALLGL